MSMQVRDGIPECHLVQLDWLESCLDRPSRREDLSPVPGRLKRVQIARFHHMPVPPHDDAVAGQSAAPPQAHFGDLAGGHADSEAVVTLAERGVHRAAPCRPSALSSPLATLAPPRPLLNQSSGRNRRPAEDCADHVTPSYRFRPCVAPSVRAACAACVTDNQADNSHSTGIMRQRVITVRYHALGLIVRTAQSCVAARERADRRIWRF